MVVNSKNSCMFVVRNINNYDANTQTKTKREPTVESTGVIQLHRNCVFREDSLLFLNHKSFIMRNTNDECANGVSKAISAEQVINSILFSDDPKHLRVHLRALMDAYLLQPEQDMDHAKGAVYSTFLILDDVLQMIENNVNTERRVL